MKAIESAIAAAIIKTTKPGFHKEAFGVGLSICFDVRLQKKTKKNDEFDRNLKDLLNAPPESHRSPVTLDLQEGSSEKHGGFAVHVLLCTLQSLLETFAFRFQYPVI